MKKVHSLGQYILTQTSLFGWYILTYCSCKVDFFFSDVLHHKCICLHMNTECMHFAMFLH